MPSAPFFVAAVSLAIWLYLFLARGNFWNLQPFDDDDATHTAPATWPVVTAIIPARNEAETIAQTIASLSQQNYLGKFSIIVIDDHSADATANLAQESAQANRKNSNANIDVTIISAPPLQPGWTGKLSALNAGVLSAMQNATSPPNTTATPSSSATANAVTLSTAAMQNAATRECTASAVPQSDATKGALAPAVPASAYFWFTDADIVHAPDTLTRLVARAEHQSLDLTSLMVLLRAETLPEKFLIPPFLFFFLMLYPPAKIADPKSKIAGAAGGCILLRRDALDRIGGLASIRSEVIDDCAIARAVKHSTAAPAASANPQNSAVQSASPNKPKIWMGLTRKSRSLRAYTTFAEIRDMIARTAFTQLHYSALLLIGTLLGLAITYLAPIALLFTHDTATRLIALSTWLLMSLLFLPTIRFYRNSTHWAASLPLAAAFYAAATFISATRYWTNRGAQWKGRSQAPQSSR
ncbi:MAG TPA: glycosyltransferase [Candidatus Acidoferrum sp.]|nr:glycosyltransferase [Candidatus Acidoferrum sp.]